MEIKKVDLDWVGKNLTIETGEIAKLASGAVMLTYGKTQVLATIVVEKAPKENIEFLPLSVHYQEKAFAAGRIPGSFHKKEGKSTEKEIIASRLIDRSLRPIFPKYFHNATQIVTIVLSYDSDYDPVIGALIAASAALAISDVPVEEIIGAIRIGMKDGNLVVNPGFSDLKTTDLDLVVAGTGDSIFMVESCSAEISEAKMLEAIKFGHENLKPVIKAIGDLVKLSGKKKLDFKPKVDNNARDEIDQLIGNEIKSAFEIASKNERNEKIKECHEKVLSHYSREEMSEDLVNSSIKIISEKIVRERTLQGRRIDGRGNKDIRPIYSKVGFLHKTHGSALFTRGETQALVVLTLGTTQDEQIIDDIEGDRRNHYMLDYIFPPYSVGEASALRAPSRREVGHGKLASRGVQPILPEKEDFPYTIRIVSEITESNGSSSMATVCGASLALMDAGVPVKEPVAGIAMGLIREGDQTAILSDIMGDEDFLGDMDFKVVGTKNGITALQMDIKTNNLHIDILESSLDQAREGRLHILSEMAKTISEPREVISSNAPTIQTIHIDKDKIRDIIGPGGKVIRDICEKTGAKIDVDDSGKVNIIGINLESRKQALSMIESIIFEPELGKIYSGEVIKLLPFGAVVKFLGKEGMVHISEMSDKKIESVEGFLKEGDVIDVKVISIEGKNKIRLSIKAINKTVGEEEVSKESDNISKEDNSFGRKRKGSFSDKKQSGHKKPRQPESEKPREKEEAGLVSEGRKYYN